MPQVTSHEVLTIDGTEANFEQVFATYYRKVFNVCYKFVQRQDTAEDLTQDIFIKAWRNRASFRQDARLETWLISIARNLCIDYYRSVRKERQVMTDFLSTDDYDAPASHREGPHSQLERSDLKMHMHAALGKMPQTHRTAVVLRDLVGLEYRDISDQLGWPVGTVKSRLSRGRTELGKRLAPLMPLLDTQRLSN
jgi:RNA polymerase sigma-70 factor, ECF subfamily